MNSIWAGFSYAGTAWDKGLSGNYNFELKAFLIDGIEDEHEFLTHVVMARNGLSKLAITLRTIRQNAHLHHVQLQSRSY